MSRKRLALAGAALLLFAGGPARADLDEELDEWLPAPKRKATTRPAEVPAPRPAGPLEKLSASDIFEVVLESKAALKECIEESLRRAPQKTGKVVIGWTITLAGEPRDVKLVSETMRGIPFAPCAIGVIQRMRFPAHRVKSEPVQFPFKVSALRPPPDSGQ